jgi:hypothetical protein
LKPESAVLDAGYFSEDNIVYLCGEGINFVTRMPRCRKQFKTLIDGIGVMDVRANAVQYGKRAVFIKSQEIKLYNQKMFAHVILDPYKKAKDIEKLLSESFENKESEEDTDTNIKYCGYLILISRYQLGKEEVLPTWRVRNRHFTMNFSCAKNSCFLPVI